MELEKRIADKEKEGRDKFVSIYGNKFDLYESDNPGERWDISGVTYSLTENKNFFVEIKDRECESTRYETCVIEHTKYQYLKEIAKDNKAEMMYCCFYTDNVGYIFNLGKLLLSDVTISTIKAPHITVENKQYFIDKLMIEIPLSLGTKVKVRSKK